MPTSKEVVMWLQEAEERFRLVAQCIPEGAPMRALMEELAETFEQRAALVEQSTDGRCGSCRWWDPYIADKTDGTACCDCKEGPLYEAGLPLRPDFGCIHWENEKP